MKIIIAGAGDVGTYLVEKLSEEQHAISVIDTSSEKLDALAARYDIATQRGNCLSYDNLSAIGVADADLYVGVTPSEELNLMSSILAKRIGAHRVVARVRHSKLLEHDDIFQFKNLGIDAAVSPDGLAAKEIGLLLERPTYTDLITFVSGKYYVAGIPVHAGSTLMERPITEATKTLGPGRAVPFAIVRNEATFMVRPDMMCTVDDHVYFMVTPDALDDLAHLVVPNQERVSRVMIFGGSRVGIETARLLAAKGFVVQLVERDRAFAEEMAEFLPGVLILHGDTRTSHFLEEHAMGANDALVAATGEPEFNIVSCLVAKKHGVAHTIALVKDEHTSHVLNELGVDTSINKKLLAADFIVRHVKKGNVRSVATLPALSCEALEFEVTESSAVRDTRIGDLSLVKEHQLIIAAVLRDGVVCPATADTVLKTHDRVIAACHHMSRTHFETFI